jgi:hypothetical protein
LLQVNAPPWLKVSRARIVLTDQTFALLSAVDWLWPLLLLLLYMSRGQLVSPGALHP